MWDLDDQTMYDKILDIDLPWATTYANMQQGMTDKQKRAKIREYASLKLAKKPDGVLQWAFRIQVAKSGRRRFDIENVPKLIVDSFCAKQITADGSPHHNLGLYPDDTLDHVILLQIAGSRCAANEETTRVEVFGVRPQACEPVA